MERQDFGDLSPGAGLFPAAEDALSRERLLREEVWKMRSYYPETARRLWRQAEEACDKMEYEGSWMYDEYPDRLMIRLLANKMAKEAAREMEREQGKDRKPDRDGREELWLEEMARVLLADEICRRRCRRQRRRQRIWAPGFPI